MSESQATRIENLGDVVVVRVLAAQLDEQPAREMQHDVIVAAAESPHCPFVLDLTQVTFMPSLSLAVLVRISSDLRSRNQRLILAGLQPTVRQVIVLTRLDRLFELADSVEAAIRVVRVI
jgi:anti-sigma B factor antagonist